MNFSKLVSIFFVITLFLYAFSGIIKWIVPFIDPTLFFSALSILSIPFYFVSKKVGLNVKLSWAMLLIFAIHLCILFSVLYTVSDYYFLIKTGKIFFNLFALILPIFIFYNLSNFTTLRKCCKISLIICVLILTFELLNNNLERIRYQEDIDGITNAFPDYMSISYFLGTMILYLKDTKSKFEQSLLIIAVIFMILLAAKGPILFLALTYIIIYRKEIKFFSLRTVYLSISVSILAFTVSLITGISIFSNLGGRLLFFSEGLEGDQSSLERVLLFMKAKEIIENNFFLGIGIGGFSKETRGIDGRLSPHNIFLEMWSEVGIISIIILIFLIVYLIFQFKRLLKKYDLSEGKAIVSICLYMLFALLVSSYLEDLRLTYFWLGISVAYYSFIGKQKKCVELAA